MCFVHKVSEETGVLHSLSRLGTFSTEDEADRDQKQLL